MNLGRKKEIAANILNVGKKRITIDSTRLPEVKGAITKTDLRSLIVRKIIKIKPMKGHSRAHANKIRLQKRKGKRKGRGSRKGSSNAILSKKERWMARVRSQRKFIKTLKNKKLITRADYRDLYSKIKNNRFRTIRLIKLYLGEQKIIKEK